MFTESWDYAFDDIEDYEVVFEEEDMVSGYLPCALIGDYSNVGEVELVFQTNVSMQSISKWGARYDKMYGGLANWRLSSGLRMRSKCLLYTTIACLLLWS